MNNDQLKVAIEALKAKFNQIANARVAKWERLGNGGMIERAKADAVTSYGILCDAIDSLFTAAQSAGKDEREAFMSDEQLHNAIAELEADNFPDGRDYTNENVLGYLREIARLRASLAKVEQEPVQPLPNRRVHELKVWPEFYDALHSGDKTFELRKDDRGFRAGDVLWLREWNPRSKTYSGREQRRLVTYLISGQWGLEKDVVCMALAPLYAAPQAQQEAGKDAELRLMLQELCKYHPNTLRTLFCDGKPTGKRIVDLVKARVWIGRPLDGNGPTMTVHSPDDAQNLKAMGYSVHGPYSEASPAQAEAHPCKDECQEAKRIGDPQYGCGSDCCMEPFPQADTQQSNPGWQRITKPGQVNVGDKLRFTIGDDKYNETAKVILYPGTDKEEIIYNKRKNYYLITSMAIENKGSQKNVECFAQQSKKGEGE